MKRYSFLWVTLAFFLVTLIGHWWFGWYAFTGEQTAHGESPDVSGYLIEMGRDTMENWQSEFLQLAWQVAGLAFLYYAGSPQSRGDDERMEAKLDYILRRLDADGADSRIDSIDREFPGRREEERALGR
jgi:5-methylthioribose kinase